METGRYHRQQLLPQVGPRGQQILGRSRVLIIGCGALGCVMADQLARAGIGLLRLADRDLVDLTNLQRQTLYTLQDAEQRLPKAAAAVARLRSVNPAVTIEQRIVDVHAGNIEELAGIPGGPPMDLVLDGTDNAQTRYLINDLCVKHAIPWVYGGCVGVEGRVMAIDPDGPCLRCIFPELPPPGSLPTCDTAGVLGPAAATVGAMQAVAAIRLLLGAPPREMLVLDLWHNHFRAIDISTAKRPDCPACGRRQFEYLEGSAAASTVALCGRNAVQVRPGGRFDPDWRRQIARRLATAGQVEETRYLLRCRLEQEQVQMTLFEDGRAIFEPLSDMERARAIYAKYVGC